MAQRLKRLPRMRETQVRTLGWEDLLEKEMATHSGSRAWRIPWREGAWWATVHRVAKSQTRLSDFTFTFERNAVSISGSERCPGGGYGNPLKYSCLENSMDRGAWWAMVHKVSKSRTQLKQLSTQS